MEGLESSLSVLLVCEDESLAREAVDACGNSIFTISDSSGAEGRLRKGHFDAVVVDMTPSNAVEPALLSVLYTRWAAIPRLVVASSISFEAAQHLINDVKVSGLLSRASFAQELRQALSRVSPARLGWPPAPPPRDIFESDPATLLSAEEIALLSPRETEILRALVEGAKPADIARGLFISIHTARNHIKALYRKLRVHSHVELIARVNRRRQRSIAAPNAVGAPTDTAPHDRPGRTDFS